MEMLVISDIHNDVENIMTYSDKIAILKFDVIIALGDFTDYNVPRGFSKLDIGKLIIEELKTFKKPILAVPGNFDKDLIELFESEGVSLHGRGVIIDGVGFYGYGGAKTPFGTSLEPDENELKKGLEKAYTSVQKAKYKIQITHNPPANTKLDHVYTGAHVGSDVVREFIEKHQPDVAVSAHIHEGRGVDEIGRTKLLNAGRFPEGHCGLISINDNKIGVKVVSLI
ncbi:MAG: metallophosphoesterase [Candidatus Aenigmatarchaeota archaeon]